MTYHPKLGRFSDHILSDYHRMKVEIHAVGDTYRKLDEEIGFLQYMVQVAKSRRALALPEPLESAAREAGVHHRVPPRSHAQRL